MSPRRVAFAVLGASLLLVTLAVPHAARGDGPAGAGASAVAIPTPRSVALEATLDRPKKLNGSAVVLAPGQGYHRALPLLARSAEALAEAGFVVVRFDWAYFTAKGQPSEGLAKEAEDFEAAIAYARKVEGVSKVLIAGKSLGSLVALARAVAHPEDVAGVALLTFPIHEPGTPATLRKGVEAVTTLAVPALVVVGDSDPLCYLPALYELAAKSKIAPAIDVVPGDHGLQGTPKSDAGTAENVDLAARALTLWARRVVAR